MKVLLLLIEGVTLVGRHLRAGFRQGGPVGLELQRQLASARTPIVVITGRDNSESRASALRAGAIAFLVKPLQEEALLAAIRSAIGSADAIQSE